ncbi:hypothetical protein M430DRAFT_57582 [Amorphotheca resinae ATCC 22711]|uniref:Uncharacterized protein n=1 Tax=Amorphotheca resinae ATCC 22711 TaxID=857342 RepID=A0A2T3B650_AMORE|nr:hypothetical protein M430DRAFT_57582 [Amorphotheca resinae ATCC 22711]PSS22232.1 hypothetical protein M430DRAFT_57582 [Amorphotheca resinae ATCC 22711]
MDTFDNSNPSDPEDEEPLYCAAPQNPEDIIWEGSDTEQTPQEIYEKRLRYENYARRYLRGQLPVLQSASLRGPLDKEWVNPWRYHPRKDFDWWQPGSEDMLFTRENVMKRAADHGLGHLTPAEALAWCKADAKAQARAQGVELSDGSSSKSTGSRSSRSDLIYSQASCGQPSATVVPQSQCDRELRSEPSGYRRSSKRPADSQWLKGSYISKRARWGAPAASSPTPMPKIQAERDRRRHRGSTGPATSSTAQLHKDPQPKTSLSHGSQYMGFDGSTETLRLEQRERDLDEFNENSGETTFVSTIDSPCGSKSTQSTPSDIADLSDHGLEPDDTNVALPIKRWHLTTPAPVLRGQKSNTTSTGLGSFELPNLPRSPENHVSYSIKPLEDDSFITDVAPSSRNLEKFEYRKRRKRSKPPRSPGPGQDFEGQSEITSRSSTKAVISKGNGKSSNLRLSNAPPTSLPNSTITEINKEHSMSNTSVASDAEKKVCPRSCKSDTSWDIRDDIGQPLHESLATDAVSSNNLQLFESRPSSTKKTLTKDEKSTAEKRRDIRLLASSQLSAGRSEYTQATDQTRDTHPPKSEVELSLNSSQHLQPPTDPRNILQIHDPAEPKKLGEFGLDRSLAPNSSPGDDSTQSHNSTHIGSPTNAQISVSTEPGRDHLTFETNHATRDTDSTKTCTHDGTQSEEAITVDGAYLADGKLQDQTRHQADSIINKVNLPEETVETRARVEIAILTDATESPHGEAKNETQVLQKAVSRDRTTSSQNSSGSDRSRRSHSSGRLSSATYVVRGKDNAAEPHDLGNRTPGGLDGDQMEEKDSWQRGLQSPWTAETMEPITAVDSRKDYEDEAASNKNRELSPKQRTIREGSDWQRIERPVTPENDGITPFKVFMTPTPPPEPTTNRSARDGFPSTQILVEAMTSNPWASNPNNLASKRSKKRVSFGVLPSEDKGDSQPEEKGFLKEKPLSPPPPAVDLLGGDDAFDDGTTTVGNKFAKHFAAAGDASRIRSHNGLSPSLKSSPAVDAMAEAFIAADREISVGQEWRKLSGHSPSRHLRPMSEAMANINTEELSRIGSSSSARNDRTSSSNTKTVGYDMGSDFGDFLGDAGGFLEEWSVETELRKTTEGKDSRAPSKKRGSFGIRSRW